MRLSEKHFSRPSCKNCGKRIYLPRVGYIKGERLKIPSHCPVCGEKYSDEIKKQFVARERVLRLGLCVILITYITIGFMILINSL